ncbi:SAM-dependent methyltransferase [Actinacidiphila alni]|uniref:S-adenosyl methyltransferase n=1 Tax=Actinacidiphila alni TaxID=380248 RepID=A0A1I2C5E5_9ACTN|nr:SAM-dependent methyltransferase [Actinacidiphila alni]SFE63332.1 S-adenosyl methyltransferase [Actinacidiphila alni]
MTDRPSWAPQGIDLTVPSVSRIYDYFLGGSHNFEVDREAARLVIRAMPGVTKISQANRAVMHRAVRFAMDRGIDQFLDIGSGIPTFGNVHEVVHRTNPGAHVVYVDNDPVAVAHSRAVLNEAGNTDKAAIAAADLRDPRTVLDNPEVKRLLDFDRPVALLLVAVLHLLSDADKPREVVAALRDVLAPGSVLVVTHATLQFGPTPSAQRGVQEVYQRTTTPLIMRTKEEVELFFDGFELVEPGVVPLPHWRPEVPLSDDDDPAVLHGLAGVGLKA